MLFSVSLLGLREPLLPLAFSDPGLLVVLLTDRTDRRELALLRGSAGLSSPNPPGIPLVIDSVDLNDSTDLFLKELTSPRVRPDVYLASATRMLLRVI